MLKKTQYHIYNYAGISIKTFLTPSIYQPDEDTFLFTKIISEQVKSPILELGSGSGYTGIYLLKRKFKVDFSDINKNSIKIINKNIKLNNLKAKVINSNLFDKIKERYNTIIFNPPYIPTEELHGYKGNDVNGGKEGIEVILNTLEIANQHLNPNGKFFFIISSLANIPLLEKKMLKNSKYKYKILHKENLAPFSCFKIYEITYNKS